MPRGLGGQTVRRRVFTLIELLVVVAIIAVLISILRPALSMARNMARRSVCASQQRQLHAVMMDYAHDFNGWGPSQVSWGGAQMIGHNGWAYSYFPISTRRHPISGSNYDACDLVVCPSTAERALSNTSYNPGRVISTRVYTSYFFLFGISDHGDSADLYGWHHYGATLENNGMNSPCPRLDFLGRYMQGCRWDSVSSTYVPVANWYWVGQPWESCAVMDTYWPTRDYWNGYGLSIVPHNHAGEEGKNITFLDGHTEWRDKNRIRQRCWTYENGMWY